MDGINGNTEAPSLPRLAVSLDEAAWMLGIDATTLRELDKSGEFGPRFLQLGGRRVVCVEELLAWLRRGCPPRGVWLLADIPASLEQAPADTSGKATTWKVPWDPTNPDYESASTLVADIAENEFSLAYLSKLKGKIRVRYMTKGKRTNWHVGEFWRWYTAKYRASDEVSDEYMADVERRKAREHAGKPSE
jgi:hypothetical protein